MTHTVKSMFEISEMTELGKQVYQIVEDGIPQGKYVIVDVHEWEEFERFRAAQQDAQQTADRLCSNCGELMSQHVGVHKACKNGEWNNWGRDARR